MAKISAGIVLYRWQANERMILLVHPGGPYWRNKDDHAWSIPKGEVLDGEDPSEAALREFAEETGARLSSDELHPLPSIRISSGKILHPFISEGDFDPSSIRSNVFELEWPPRSGQIRQFPEVDRAAWFTLQEAREKLHKGQVQLVDLLENG
ncbi:MAG: NUDIX domain-containing protein [Saprospiraceae bacterium]|nr:NUDIX domain-containing protein [Saprospiraceae bacterium]